MKYLNIGSFHNKEGDVEVFAGYDQISLEFTNIKVVNTSKKPIEVQVNEKKIKIDGTLEVVLSSPKLLEKKDTLVGGVLKKNIVDFPEGLVVSVTY